MTSNCPCYTCKRFREFSKEMTLTPAQEPISRDKLFWKHCADTGCEFAKQIMARYPKEERA